MMSLMRFARTSLHVAFALTLACMPDFGHELARVRIEKVATPAVATVSHLDGKSLRFVLHADRLRYHGGKDEAATTVLVELLREGKVVGSARCPGFDFDQEHTGGCGSTSWGGCSATVPKSGIDELRATITLDSGTMEIQGLDVIAYEDSK